MFVIADGQSHEEFRERKSEGEEFNSISGVCTGLISAVVVGSADSLAALLKLSIEAVRVAFRIGCCINDMKQVLEYDKSNSKDDIGAESWSIVVTGVGKEEADVALQGLGAQLTRPYISAVGTSSLTISGAPSALSNLFQRCDALRRAENRISLPIYGPYHASHLYSKDTLEGILTPAVGHVFGEHSVRSDVRILLPSSGQFARGDTALDLLQLAVKEILLEPARYDLTLESAVSAIQNGRRSSTCHLLCFGASGLAKSLISTLRSVGVTAVIDNADPETQDCEQRTRNEKVAIIGMSGRFPGGASDHEALWHLLSEGLDVHREVPRDRFNVETHVDPSCKGRNKSHTPYGCFIDQPGLFDPRFFNMSPREAAQTDPMARLALVTAYEALEMAGFVPNRTPSTRLDRIGTFYGQTSDDWREINAAEDIDTYFITGGVRAFAAGRLNYHFGFSGPSFSIDTACSSSMAAIQLACTSLWARDCDMAVTGGMNVLTNPDIFAGLSKGRFLSRTGAMAILLLTSLSLTFLARPLSHL